MIANLPPALILIAAALLCLALPSPYRRLLLIVAPLIALFEIVSLPEGASLHLSFLDYHLFPLQVDRLSRLFGVIFALITTLTGLYSFSSPERGEQVAKLLYLGGSLGVTFAGDYVTLYLFWELMALASFYLIVARKTVASRRAAFRYLFVHLTGGVILLAGIILHLNEMGTIWILPLVPHAPTVCAWLILAGFALNAAAVPLHAWLPDAYPQSTVTGGVLLSALTTKTALYALARVFPGWEILVIVGIVMALYGVWFAFLADDIREVLAYHIVSQVGYMVAGVGLGTELSLNGATAHAFCHILYKALLFMGGGAVLQATGRSRLSSLGGLLGALPFVFFFYMVGAVSIAGFPFFNGFISKSMVVAGFEEMGISWGVLLLEAAAVGTFLSVGLKVPYFTWFGTRQEERGKRKEEKPSPSSPSPLTPRLLLPRSMYAAMGITAFCCLLLGIRPDLLYTFLPYPVTYQPYTATHLLQSSELLAATALAFLLVVARLQPKATLTLDVDWFYRRPARALYTLFVERPGKIFDRSEALTLRIASTLARKSQLSQVAERRPLSYTIGALLVTFLLFALWSLVS